MEGLEPWAAVRSLLRWSRVVRFPFTFMGVMSLLLGLWIMLYFLIRKPDGPVSGGIEVAMAFVMIGFGSWVVWRRLTGREGA